MMGAQGARQVESGNEWATPWWVVRDAAAMLQINGFDLDPAATEDNAKAPAFFTKSRNGLGPDWFGHVWLNPPFSRSMEACGENCRRSSCVKRGNHLLDDQHGAKDFARKAVDELEDGNVKAIAWHGPVAPDTDWYGLLWPFVHERADYAGRIAYNGGRSGGTFPSQTLILKPERRKSGIVPTCLLPVKAEARSIRSPIPCPVEGCFDGYGGTIYNAWDQEEITQHLTECRALKLEQGVAFP